MSSIADRINSALFYEDPRKPPPTESRPVVISPSAGEPVKVEDGETYRMLAQKVFGRESAYAKFVKSMEALRPVIPDDTTRFNAALATLQASGLSKTTIAQAVVVHQQALDSERRDFETTITKDGGDQVRTCEQALQTLTEKTKANTAEIARLQAGIDKMTEEAATLTSQRDTLVERTTTIKQEFEVAFSHIKERIQTDALRLGR